MDAVLQVEFFKNVRDVGLDGVFRDEQAGKRSVGWDGRPAAMRRNASSSRSVRIVSSVGGAAGSCSGTRASRVIVARGHCRCQHRFTAGDDADGVDQFLGCGVFEDEAAGPRAEGGDHVLVVAEGGEDQYFHAGHSSGCFDAV